MPAKTGGEFVLEMNTGTLLSPVWVKVVGVKEVTRSGETGKADVTTRDNDGFRAWIPTLKDVGLEIQMVYDPTNSHFLFLENAWLNKTQVQFRSLDGPSNVPGSKGMKMVTVITNFSEPQPLEDAVIVSITASPTYAPGYPPTPVLIS